ncbi:MAG: orotidine-5'-phosphate decarboxylase, partial [Candidatus Aegiribacteria sp.]|nr:orotidine-5'-phosphate decarboxylase [Candidatus Aegiribacteria sp.]
LYVAVTSREMANMKALFEELAGLPVGLKVGLELFVKEGPSLLEEIREAGFPMFLDLKFHDIPFTVAGAVRSACCYEPELINIHASGGFEMMKAAADAVEGKTRILAVTVLTSLSPEDLCFLGFEGEPADLVEKMAVSAKRAGIHGVVCSPLEAAIVREATGPDFLIVTPGVRPSGASKDDQKRTATPFNAIMAGATSLVVGRPITQADNPRGAAESILDEISQALHNR